MRYKKRREILDVVEPELKYRVSKVRSDLMSGEWDSLFCQTLPNLRNHEARIMDLEVKLTLLLEHLSLEVVNLEAKTILKAK